MLDLLSYVVQPFLAFFFYLIAFFARAIYIRVKSCYILRQGAVELNLANKEAFEPGLNLSVIS